MRKDIADIKIAELLANQSEWLKEMITYSDKKLEKNLIIVQKQMEMAAKQKKDKIGEYLSLYESLIIEARVLKMNALSNEEL